MTRPLVLVLLLAAAPGAALAHGGAHGSSEAAEAGAWTCPMHPDVRADAPGECPKCGMALVPAGHGDDDHMRHMEQVRADLRARLGAAYDAPVPGLDGADPERGRRLYAERCAACHGAEGRGDGPAAAGLPTPPANLADPEHARFYSDAGRVEIIRSGIPGTPMPGFAGSLDDAEILDIYAWLVSLRGPAPDDDHHAGGDHHHAGGDHRH